MGSKSKWKAPALMIPQKTTKRGRRNKEKEKFHFVIG